MTISNMSAEMGAKAAMMLVSQSTCERINAEFGSTVSPFIPDEDAEYRDQFEFDMSVLEPLISIPPYVDSIKTVEELQGTPIDQSFIGSCTNGRLEDLHIASKILNGKRTKTRCIVIPASKKVFLMALEDGTIGTLIRAGCVVGSPTCGPCVGAHMGLLGKNEVAISTSNRNFPGRMGDRSSKIYLGSAATAAASALEGKITDPRMYLKS
jgi:3-isopropylmalate/(R)-2-methylmalate dehydratase large subunit